MDEVIAKTEKVASKEGGPVILQFNPESTPGHVYEITITRVEEALMILAACGTPDQLRAGRLRLAEFEAILQNAEHKRAIELADKAVRS